MSKKDKRKAYYSSYKRIDVPFTFRNSCFYCGEIATELDHVPPVSRIYDYIAIYDRHTPLLVPSCSECNQMLHDSLQSDVFTRFDDCKKLLTSRLSKYIRYGNIWTEEDLEYAQFTGNFASFGDNVQGMALLAKKRIDWTYWPVSVEGTELVRSDEPDPLTVRGRKFSDIDAVIKYAHKVDKIPKVYFEAVIEILGVKQLERAYNFCMALPVKSGARMKEVLRELEEDVKGERD